MAGTILVVEDNPTTRKMLRVVLSSEGYGIIEAPDARAAIAAAEQALPDLVLQDLILPDMDGLELVARLREIAGPAEMPVLALSGFLSRLEESRTAAAGFAELLVKPIEPSRLVEIVRAYLPHQPGPAASLGEGPRILIVDDDPIQLKLARLHFEHLGFDVATAGSGRDGLAAARSRPPDAILSDVFMEDCDGFELCLEVRQDAALARVPVVLVSNRYGSESDHDLARRVGANALVVRTPDYSAAIPAIVDALAAGAPVASEPPSDGLKLQHAEQVINELERQTRTLSGLAQRSALQAAQLALLSGVADALTRKTDTDLALRDVLAATLDAAGISKGALMLADGRGSLELRQQVGFSQAEAAGLRQFFGHLPLLREIVERGAAVTVPSSPVPSATSEVVLKGANVSSVQIAPLVSDGRGVGAMIIGATRTDLTSADAVTFARAVGNQIVQSLELTRTVADLAASEQRYRTLLESASDAIAVLTSDGIIREVNHRWMTLTGRQRDQLVGRNVGLFLRTAARDNTQPMAVVAALTSANDRPTPVDIQTPDGRTVQMEFSSTSVEIRGERLVFTIGRDVTEQRALEERLRQAQKLEAVGQLAGGVAHDFNNMLTAILGFTDLILADPATGQTIRGDLLEVRNAGRRAAALTRQLLAFSRKQILQPQVLDINALVAGTEAMLRRLVIESVQFRMSLGADTGMVNMDPTQIEQILVNLVVNAADAMPQGGTLTIETRKAGPVEREQPLPPVPPGEYAVLTVSDTGVGMDNATRERIFEPFFTTKGPAKGTGLGLATVYGIVKQSGGDISVSTEPGIGTTFSIYLPRVGAAAPADAARPTGTVRTPGGSETILLVEDEEAVRRLARMALERSGYRVLEAVSRDDAARVAAEYEGAIDLIVSDVIMPNSAGLPISERLAHLRPPIRTLYMSGYADDEILRHGVMVEGMPFLQKPFTREQLVTRVREVLDTPPKPR